jgi:hypothetical protein
LRLVDVGVLDFEVLRQQAADVRGHRLGDGEFGDAAEPPTHELLLDRLQQVSRFVLADGQVGVAGDLKRVAPQHLHAAEERAEVLGDELLKPHKLQGMAVGAVAGTRLGRYGDEPWQDRRNLHACKAFSAGGMPQHDREAERQVRDVRERMRGVHGKRRQHGVYRGVEVLLERLALLVLEVRVVEQADAGFGELRPDRVLVVRPRLLAQVDDALSHDGELLSGGEAVLARRGQAALDLLLQSRDADHEELVQVRVEDGEELDSLQQRMARVHRLFQHATVELQPVHFAVEVAVLRRGRSSGPTRPRGRRRAPAWLFVHLALQCMTSFRFGRWRPDLEVASARRRLERPAARRC